MPRWTGVSVLDHVICRSLAAAMTTEYAGACQSDLPFPACLVPLAQSA
jgi:hypothetical protein